MVTGPTWETHVRPEGPDKLRTKLAQLAAIVEEKVSRPVQEASLGTEDGESPWAFRLYNEQVNLPSC
ncbi:hypothetical protein BJY00DRAFT_286568 [Aspergillus carlsbadensis]|nr:hypothetical protein BJY00DRAFT_286568 [Aspergillus carlsbadensis]